MIVHTKESHSDKEQFPPNQTANETEPVNDEPTPTVTDSASTTHRYPRRVHVPPDRAHPTLARLSCY